MRRRPLFWQIFPVSLLISLCTVLAVSWFATTTFKKFYYDQMVVDIEARALLLEQKILDLAPGVPGSPPELLSSGRTTGPHPHHRGRTGRSGTGGFQ